MEEERKKVLFCVHIFNIFPCVFTQISIGRASWMRNLTPHPTSTHTAYFWWTPLPQNQEIPENTWWWCQKYAVWVLVGCGIKFRIQRALPLGLWVKRQGYMSKIWTKKIVFFYNKYVNSTIMVVSFYWNYIGSWIPTHKIYYWHVFL